MTVPTLLPRDEDLEATFWAQYSSLRQVGSSQFVGVCQYIRRHCGDNRIRLGRLKPAHHVPHTMKRALVIGTVPALKACCFILEVGPHLLVRQLGHNLDPRLFRDQDPVR